MDKLKLFFCINFFILIFTAFTATGSSLPFAEDINTVYAEDNYHEGTENEDDTVKSIMDELDIYSVEKELDKLDTEGEISFSRITECIMDGNFSEIGGLIKDAVMISVSKEINLNKNLLLQLLSVVLVGAVFANLSGLSGKYMTPETGFYVTYLIITSILLSSFTLALEIASDAISEITAVMRVLAPIYIVALNFLGETVSSSWLYRILVIGIWAVELFILNFIIPMIRFYVILSIVNNINREDMFSKLASLLRSVISWILKSIVVFIAGINVIKMMLAPTLDSLGRSTINRVISALPGGSMVSLMTGTFISAGKLVRNSIGVAGMVILVTVVMVPVIKVAVMLVMTKLTAALVQPVGDKRYAEGIDGLSEGLRLVFTALGAALVIFMLSIALMTAS